MSEVVPGDLVQVVRCSVVWLVGLVQARSAPGTVECGDLALVVTVTADGCSVLLLTLRGGLGWLGRSGRDSLTAWVERVQP